MKRIVLSVVAVAIVAGIVAALVRTSTSANAETASPSAKEIRGATPYAQIENEPPAKLIVDPPVPDLLAQGVVWIAWRVENVNIGPMSGKEHLHASPRVGHLHIHVDDLPWLWAHMSTTPIDVALLPPRPHKIRIDLVNAVHQAVESKTVTFDIPKGASPH